MTTPAQPFVDKQELLEAGFTEPQAEILWRKLNELYLRPIDRSLTEQARAAFQATQSA